VPGPQIHFHLWCEGSRLAKDLQPDFGLELRDTAELEGVGWFEVSNSAPAAVFRALSRQPWRWLRTLICCAAQIAPVDAYLLLSNQMTRSQRLETTEEGCTLSLASADRKSVLGRIFGMACKSQTQCRCFRRGWALGVLTSASS
jgi:hypothetical protein